MNRKTYPAAMGFVQPYAAQWIKENTTPGSFAHVGGHFALGAFNALANGGNGGDALLSGTAAGAAEIAIPKIAQHLYGTSDPNKLTAVQKRTVLSLANLGGIVVGGAGGNPVNAVNAGSAAENAVGNNWLTPEENARRKELQIFIDKTIEEMSSENFSYNRKLPSDEYLKAYKELRDLDELSEKRDHEFNQAYDNCRNNANCEQFYYLHVTLRDKLNEPGIEQFKRDRENGKLSDNWIIEPDYKNAFHNFTNDGLKIFPEPYPNAKYSHKNGQYEVIVNKSSGEIITLPSSSGTFNYYPNGEGIRHKDYDVDPWMDFGSGRGDNTTYESRKTNSPWYRFAFGEFGDSPNNEAINKFNKIDKERKTNE